MGIDIMESIGGSQFGAIFTTVGTILMYALAGVVVFGFFFVLGYFFFRPMLYRINAHIYARRHGKYIQIGTDRARIKKIRTKFFGLFGAVKQTKLQLLKRKINLPSPDFEKLYPNDLRNSPGTLNYLKFGELDYALCDIELDEVEYEKDKKGEYKLDGGGNKIVKGTISLIPIETDMKTWHLQEIQDSRERNSPTDFLQRNQVIIAAGLVLIVLGIGIYGGIKWFDAIFGGLKTALAQLDSTLEALNRCRV